jgi:sulfur-carrier protein adenylyltransferase/sulfurtransferase
LRREKQAHTIESFAAEDTSIMAMPEFQQLCNEAKKEIQEIDSQQLRRMQQAGEDFALIDVREPDEVQQGSIPGAVPIPRGVLELHIDEVTTDKNKQIVLYCGGGSRSALAAWMLKKMGFKHPISLAGGYRGWTQG